MIFKKLAVLFLCAATMVAHSGESGESEVENVTVELDLLRKGGQFKPVLGSVPGSIRNLYKRYIKLVYQQAPLVLMRPDTSSKDFTWTVCRNNKGNTLVFLTQNKTSRPRSITFKLSGKTPLTPTYRRIYSEDKGKTWKTTAFEPPHDSITGCPQAMPEPRVIEIPPYSYQYVTVRLK